MTKKPKVEVDYVFIKDVNFKVPEMAETYGDYIRPNSLHKAIVVTPEDGEEFYIIPDPNKPTYEGFVADKKASFYKQYASNEIVRVKTDEQISELPIEPEDFLKMSEWAKESELDFYRKMIVAEVAGKLSRSIVDTRAEESVKEEFDYEPEISYEEGMEFDGMTRITPEDVTAQLTGLLQRNPQAFINIFQLIQSI